MNGDTNKGRLISVFGLPCGFSYFIAFVIQSLIKEALKDYDYASIANLEQLKASLSDRQHPNLFIFSDRPEQAVVEAYLRIGAPILVVCEDPINVLHFIEREHKVPPDWAMRTTQQSFVGLGQLFESNQSLKIERTSDTSVRMLIDSAANHFGIPIDEKRISDIYNNLDHEGRISDLTTLETVYEFVSSQNKRWKITEKSEETTSNSYKPLIRNLRELTAGNRPETYEWPVELFVSGDFPGSSFRGRIDLTGPARCILYGPYLSLPPGAWTIRVSANVTGNQSGNGIEVQFSRLDYLLFQRFELPEEGSIEIKATIESIDARAPSELRLLLTEGAIEGRMEIMSVRVSRVYQT